jgi:tRNA threonylcarbamoyladenosine biosynthesis protein TsaB
MATILNIETATDICSVALESDGDILFDRISSGNATHAALIGPFIDEALKKAKSEGKTIEAVAVSSGPGSYTGLRIGASAAKGVCFGLNVPLIAIKTLEILTTSAIRLNNKKDCLYCPMIDARRMEVYAAVFDNCLNEIRTTQADVVTADTYASFLKDREVCFFGNGAAKCQETIDSENAVFLPDVQPLASEMVLLAEQAFNEKQFENVAYYDPFYLKEFHATIAKNKVLGAVGKNN